MLLIIPKFRLPKAGNSCNPVFDPGLGPEMANMYDDNPITPKVMCFPPKWHIARGNTYVFGTLLFLWRFNDPGWRPSRLTPQGLKDIFCRLKLLSLPGRRTTHQKHWTHCNKGHFT